MTLELDQALTTGDETAIDEALNEMELDEDLLFGDEDGSDSKTSDEQTVVVDSDKSLPEVIDTTKQEETKQPQGSDDPSNGELCDQLGDGVREIDGQLYVAVNADNAEVAGKNGKHTIPYSVLDKARTDGFKSQQRASELEGQLANEANNSKKMELFYKQLEEAGITPDKLPEELLNDPDALESLQDEIGGTAGQVITALVKQLQSKTQANEQPQAVGEIDAALASEDLAELRGWEANDKDRWDMAIIIDEKLKKDPQFNAMPLNERFAEVQRRVKTTFGDPVQASIEQSGQKPETQQPQEPAAKEPQQSAQDQALIPNSPSSLGGTTSDTSQAAHEALASQDAFALENSLEKMSPEAVEEFLANAALALD
ncbi:hypothetical protein LZS85_15575 [Aliivibrio fischeri]|uniref:hypothetical protein n=1 Tax=Aliivibrio fischeri TaxID=668 RepID=UPI001F475AB0|nr:hypothetical protein [Aliivibrio fischeri]MCE7567543.1 hypothetical protein [Aliivibrio fischeri]